MPTPATTTNPTAEAVVARLPKRPILSTRDIADAIGYATVRCVVEAVESGDMRAIRTSGKGRYLVSREEAARWIRTLGETAGKEASK